MIIIILPVMTDIILCAIINSCTYHNVSTMHDSLHRIVMYIMTVYTFGIFKGDYWPFEFHFHIISSRDEDIKHRIVAVLDDSPKSG